MSRRDERWALDNFTRRYRVPTTGAAADVERHVIGAVWGVNGYTTRDQADLLGDQLSLTPQSKLLDIGAGRGWPGLYLAERHGCRVVLSDLPHEGLAIAMETARQRHLATRACAVVASTRRLPLRPSVFDAVVHTDVLCCLSAKLSALRGSRQVLKPGGRTAFFTIYVPSGLSGQSRRRALAAAPRYGWSRVSNVQLMQSAGFVDIDETDCTDRYLQTLRGWHDHSGDREDELVALWGADLFKERQEARRAAIEAVQDGLQRRVLISAAKRPKRSTQLMGSGAGPR
jgi:cyclopropane fatty-acyl-phospholipid synthase-like methyltransferase